MFALLIRARIRGLWNVALHNARRYKLLSVTMSFAAVAMFVLIFLGFLFFLMLVRSPEDQREMVYEIFYFLFLFLLAGAVPFVASTLLHSSDYLLLAAAPVRPRTIVAAKLIDATVTNSLQFTVIGIPAITACGVALGLSPAGWAVVPFLVALFVLLPALITSLMLLIALAILGMRRVRSAITAVNAVMAAFVCLTIVSQTGRIHVRDMFGHGVGAAVSGTSASAHAGPSAPFAWTLIELSEGRFPDGLRELLGAGVLIALLFMACMQWGSRLLTATNLSLDSEGEGPIGPGARGLRPSRSGILRLFPAPVASIMAKDLRYVTRDSVLLSQLSMPVILFFVPFLMAIQQSSLRIFSSPSDIYPFAVAMTGVIVFMQTSIISLSSIGLEGRSFWISLTSPITGRSFLWAKFLMSTLVSGAFGLALTVVSAVAFQAPPAVGLVEAALVLLCTAALCGLGVGISGALPRFVYENPAHRVSAWALILGFVATIGFLTVFGTIFVVTWHVATTLTDRSGFVYLIGTGLLVVISLLSIAVPMAIGARRIETYQWEH